MSERLAKVSGWALGLVVAAVVAFGLSVVTAKPAYAETCQDDGWGHVGQQPDEATCQDVCEVIHGPDVVGRWHEVTGCCLCLW